MKRRSILKSAFFCALVYNFQKYKILNASPLEDKDMNILTGICSEISSKIDYIKENNDFENYLDYKHDVIHYFSMFDYRTIPDMVVPYFYTIPTKIWNSGKIPFLTWYPSTSTIEKTPNDICKKIYTGEFDHYLDRCCRSMKEYLAKAVASPIYGEPILFLRFAHEMNIHYRLYAKTDEFIKMWHYIYNYLRNYGLKKDQVLFIFSPNCVDLNTVPFEEYYPGDDFTEWVGLDGYNWGGRGAWKSFSEIFEHPMERMNKLTIKPVAICEFGTSANTNSGYDACKKALWLKDTFEWLSDKNNLKKYNVRMAIYFNMSKLNDIDSGLFIKKTRCTVCTGALNYEHDEFRTIENICNLYFKKEAGFLNSQQKMAKYFLK